MVIEGGISGRPLQNYLHKTLFTYCLQPLMLALLPSPESTLAHFPSQLWTTPTPSANSAPYTATQRTRLAVTSLHLGEYSPIKIFLLLTVWSHVHTTYSLSISPSYLSKLPFSKVFSPITHPCWIWSITYLNLQANSMETAWHIGKSTGVGDHRSGFNSWCHHLLKVCLE